MLARGKGRRIEAPSATGARRAMRDAALRRWRKSDAKTAAAVNTAPPACGPSGARVGAAHEGVDGRRAVGSCHGCHGRSQDPTAGRAPHRRGDAHRQPDARALAVRRPASAHGGAAARARRAGRRRGPALPSGRAGLPAARSRVHGVLPAQQRRSARAAEDPPGHGELRRPEARRPRARQARAREARAAQGCRGAGEERRRRQARRSALRLRGAPRGRRDRGAGGGARGARRGGPRRRGAGSVPRGALGARSAREAKARGRGGGQGRPARGPAPGVGARGRAAGAGRRVGGAHCPVDGGVTIGTRRRAPPQTPR